MESTIAHEERNPFPGLRPFREDESHLFFGRENQVDVMVDKLARRRLLAVVGTSGSGKSSLVNCGLRPALHGGLMASAGIRWCIVQFRPGNSPLCAMARTLAGDKAIAGGFHFDTTTLQGLIAASLSMSKRGLSEVYERSHLEEGTNLLIVVDQFEELFRYRDIDSLATAEVNSRSQEATAFVNLLLDAKTQRTFPIYVVLTMRSDFLGDCAEFAGLPEAINDGQYLVPRLTRDERRAAIAGPVGVGGATISPLLLTRLVNDVGDNPDQLSILQHAMNRTWANWQHAGKGEGELDLPQYAAIGTMAHALDQHAEKAYGELHHERQQKICEKIFKALTDKRTNPRGVRRPTRFAVLCELAAASPEEVAGVIDVFRKPSRSFLMPPLEEALENDTVVDISHESLMRLWERLNKWSDDEMQAAQLYCRLLETATWHAAGRAALWDDPDLQCALDWREKEQPNERWAELYGGCFAQAMTFLDASREKRDKRLQEKEELRQRELTQAQALAEERQRRIEQQARDEQRLRRRVVALAGVAALTLVVSILAIWESRVARQKTREATEAEQMALTAKQHAEEESRFADERKHEAEERTREAEIANGSMRREALYVRLANLESMSNYADMAGALSRDSSMQEAAMWNGRQGQALLELGNYDDAERLLSDAINVAPDDINLRTSRGYMYLLVRQPAKALEDFAYVRDRIAPHYALNDLNLTIAQAALGDFPAARISLRKAIEHSQSGSFGGGSESAVPSEITEATGRTTLSDDRPTFEAALYYMRANLEAYAADAAAFQSALSLADEKARPLPVLKRNEAVLTALTWAWLHMDVRCPDSGSHCKDYGALVSQAALWERVGEGNYKPWAACDYQRFQRRHARWRLPKYDPFASLVDTNTRLLGGVVSASSCFATPKLDALALETEAREDVAKKKYQEAIKRFDDAYSLADEPDKMRLLLSKADALYRYGADARGRGPVEGGSTAFQELKHLCDQVLVRDPREAKAYFWRAIALDWLDKEANRGLILADLHRALAIDPTDMNSLSLLDDLAPDDRSGADVKYLADIDYLKEHLGELDHYYRMYPYTSKAFLHQARLAQSSKDYRRAMDYIDKAINMKPDQLSLYDVKKQIELAAGVPPDEVNQELFLGHVQAYFVVKRRSHKDDSVLLATISKKIETEMAQNRPKQ
jgi:hypothetical protein